MFLARRFLFVFASDFISALVAIIIIMLEKSFSSDKDRLRMARRLDIENLADENVNKSSKHKREITDASQID